MFRLSLAVGFALVGIAGWSLGLLRRPGTPPVSNRRPGVNGAPIGVLERVRLGATEQWILLRGEDSSNPIILFLHGGPGTSQLTANRRATRALERDFVVVNWDQRGAGKSFRAGRDSGAATIDRYVEDTRELAMHLLARFGQDRLILVGHSWGSVIGVLAAARYPQLFSCYVGIGQVADMRAGERESYRWTLEQAEIAHDRAAIRALKAMGEPPYSGDWRRKTVTQRRYLAKFGGEVHRSGQGAFRFILPALIASREYWRFRSFSSKGGTTGRPRARSQSSTSSICGRRARNWCGSSTPPTFRTGRNATASTT